MPLISIYLLLFSFFYLYFILQVYILIVTIAAIVIILPFSSIFLCIMIFNMTALIVNNLI